MQRLESEVLPLTTLILADLDSDEGVALMKEAISSLVSISRCSPQTTFFDSSRYLRMTCHFLGYHLFIIPRRRRQARRTRCRASFHTSYSRNCLRRCLGMTSRFFLTHQSRPLHMPRLSLGRQFCRKTLPSSSYLKTLVLPLIIRPMRTYTASIAAGAGL